MKETVFFPRVMRRQAMEKVMMTSGWQQKTQTEVNDAGCAKAVGMKECHQCTCSRAPDTGIYGKIRMNTYGI